MLFLTKNISAENQILLTIAKFELSDDDKSLIEKQSILITDWNQFCIRAIKLGIGNLAFSQLQKIKNIQVIPSKIMTHLNAIYHRSLLRNILLSAYFKKIQNSFSEKGIPIIPLKGIYLAETFYIDIGLRQMSDIDLLVQEKDTEKSLKILSELGFVAKERIKTAFIKDQSGAKHLPTMVKNDVFVEIHFRVRTDNKLNSIDIGDYWKSSSPVMLFNTQTLALSPENLLQYLCIHLERHFNEGKIQLYQFTDLLILLKKHYRSINWEMFEKSCISNNCTKAVGKILFILHNFFSAHFPENIEHKFNLHEDNNTSNLFIHYLNCDENSIKKAVGIQNIKNLKKVKGFGNRVRFVIGDLFPSRTFMYQRYHIKQKRLLLLYYGKRLIKGLFILFQNGPK
jgi:hypothetical protein